MTAALVTTSAAAHHHIASTKKFFTTSRRLGLPVRTMVAKPPRWADLWMSPARCLG